MAKKIGVLGSGAMATACSILLADQQDQIVSLWARDEGHARSMREERENKRLLPGITIPDRVTITTDVRRVICDADLVAVAIPSRYLRECLETLTSYFQAHQPVVSVVKGIEIGTFMRPSEIISEVLGPRNVVVMSGPSHAEEIAKGLPAGVVAASTNAEAAAQVQQTFSTDQFRIYTNEDVIGVELGGCLKNVVAIAAGISDGLKYGDNAKSALVTRAQVEMIRFGICMGARAETFSGLAGFGDLVATCLSRHSRNRRLGQAIGEGKTLAEVENEVGGVAEGVTTARAVYEIALQRSIEMPISTEVYRVLFEGKSPVEATLSLMNRPLQSESVSALESD